MNTITIDHLNEALNAATPQADGKYSVVDVFNAAQKLAEQSAQPEPVPFPLPEHERAKLKAQQAKSESVDPHAALRAEYIRQRDSVPCELGFYLWEATVDQLDKWVNIGTPDWSTNVQYHYTDISCYVSKDGEPAIRMLRTDAQKLYNTLGNSVIWYDTAGKAISEDLGWEWAGKGTYTYAPKATIKLNGVMVTPEQAAAEWESKKDTCDLLFKFFINGEFSRVATETCPDGFSPFRVDSDYPDHQYQIRTKALKQVKWEGSREDVIALLKEKGLL